MNRAGVIVLLLAAAGCAAEPADGTATAPTPSGPSEPAPTGPPIPTSSPLAVHLDELGISLTLPPGWVIDSDDGQLWVPDTLPYPSRPGVRVAASRPRGYSLAMAAAELDPPLSLDEWAAMQERVIAEQSSCSGSPDREPINVDGEAAMLAVYDRSDCGDDHHVLAVSVTHAGRGYALHWVAPSGEEESGRELFQATLDSIVFDPEGG